MSHSVYVFLECVSACSGLIQLYVPCTLVPRVLCFDIFAIPKSISFATPSWYLQEQLYIKDKSGAGVRGGAAHDVLGLEVAVRVCVAFLRRFVTLHSPMLTLGRLFLAFGGVQVHERAANVDYDVKFARDVKRVLEGNLPTQGLHIGC